MVKEFAQPQQYALILGGSSGLGLASAKKLAQHGMGLFILHRNTRAEMQAIENDFDEIRAWGVPVHTFNYDILDKEKRAALIAQLRQQNIQCSCVLHSVAKGSLKAMIDKDNAALSEEDLSITMRYMAYSLLDWVSDLHQAGLLAADTRVIAFTSEGSRKAWKHYGAVAAAKAALEAIIRNIALEFAPYGVKANCIQAGITPTRSMQLIPGSEQLIAHTATRNPFKRMTRPEDVANVVYLLCMKEAAWINGSIIPVDGGEHIA